MHHRGPHSTLAFFPNGLWLGGMNAGAPELAVPDWSNDTVALSIHAKEYLALHGVSSCQISEPQVLGGSGGRTLSYLRRIDNIVVPDSNASVRFNRDDVTTVEELYWPAIPATVVADAKSFRDAMNDPKALAAYREKLPPEARDGGEVVIRHSPSASTEPFRAFAGWDVLLFVGGMPTTDQTFDTEGKPIE
ncbi:MAG: hypothetical protein ACXVEF_23585 [Polyangiales bacterium]